MVVKFLSGMNFFSSLNHPDWLRDLPILWFFGGKRACHEPITHFHLVPRLSLGGTIPPLSPQAFTACIGTTLSILLLYLTIICALLFYVRKFKLLASYLEPLFCHRTSLLPEFPCRVNNISGLGCCITAIITRDKRAAFGAIKNNTCTLLFHP